MIVPFSYIEAMPSYDPGSWPHCSSDEVSPQNSFITKMPVIRTQHNKLVCDLTMINPERLYPAIDKKTQMV